MKNPRNILITGASSGLGAALALYYAGPGIRLELAGRDALRLEDAAAACRVRKAAVTTTLVDVTDRPAVKNWIAEAEARGALDLVIANAGISGGTGDAGVGSGEKADQAQQIFAVNIGGVLNTIDAVLPAFQARGRGQIAVISSIASFSGWPGAPAYSSSKGAVRMYAEALRGTAGVCGVEVNAVCPGFIATPMTEVNPFPMPFIMSAERAATIIARGLCVNRGRIAFPLPTYAVAWVLAALPQCLSGLLLKRFPAKPSTTALS